LCLGEEPPFIKHGGDAVEHDIVLLFGEPTKVFDHLCGLREGLSLL